MISKEIADFLDFIREAEQLNRIARANEAEANEMTQDILHCLEIEQKTYNEKARLAIKLAEVRKDRRAAKDLRETTQPLVDWAQANQGMINSMRRVLGEIRKAEKATENRAYTPRTNIMEEEK